MDTVDVDFVRNEILSGTTHKRLSDELKALYPGQRGFSERSVRPFCQDNGIHYRGGLSSNEVDIVVSQAVQEVGPTYGRRTMRGLLVSRGIALEKGALGILFLAYLPITKLLDSRGQLDNQILYHTGRSTSVTRFTSTKMRSLLCMV